MKKIIILLALVLLPLCCFADYYGSWKIDDGLTFTCNTHDPSTGAAADADSVPSYRVYEDETGTAVLNGSMALIDDSNTTGFYSEQITLSAANGFEKGKSYTVYISAAVGSTTGTISHNFQVEAEVDSNTVSSSVVASSVTGAVGSVTGNVGGNVTGSVGSVTAGVTVSTNNDKTGYGLADDAITASKFDETTAYPLVSADSGSTQVARTGADSDTLETLSDQIDLQATASAQTTAQADLDLLTGADGAILATSQPNYAPNTTTPPTAAAIRAEMDSNSTQLAAILEDTGTTMPGTLSTIAGYIDTEVTDILTDTGTTIPGTLSTIEGKIDTVDTVADGIQTDLDNPSQYQATGFSTHSASDVVTAMETDGSKLDHLWETTEDDGGVRRFTTNALEQAPSGSGGDATSANQTTIIGHLTDIKGATWSTETMVSLAAKQTDIETDTQDIQTQIGTAGAGLTNVPWNASWDAEVQSEAADALTAYDPPTNTEFEARTLPTADYFDYTSDTTISNVTQINGTSIAGTGTQVAGAFEYFFNVATPAKTINDCGVSGSGLSAADVWTYGTRVLTAGTNLSIPSASDNADAVWDEATADHTTGTTFGGKNQIGVPSATLNDYKAAGFSTHSAADVWSAASRELSTPDNYKADVSGLAQASVCTETRLARLDASVSSRSSHDDPDPSGYIDAAISSRSSHTQGDVKTAMEGSGSYLDLVRGYTSNLYANQGNWLTATGFSTLTAQQVWQYIVEDAFTAEQLMRLYAAMMAGAIVVDGNTMYIKSLDGTVNRIVFSGSTGSRSVISRDVTD